MVNKDVIKKITTKPGIYCFKNKINNKCYIGQAVNIRKRILNHIQAFIHSTHPNIVIYKAFKKYGIEQFTLSIIVTLNTIDKNLLDELEKKYIQEYNSYDNGYNSTLGGDAGVLGYKQTEEVKQHLREVRAKQLEEQAKDLSTWIKALNIITKEIIQAPTINEMARMLNVSRTTISKCVNKQQLVANKTWVFAKIQEDFPDDNELRQSNTQFKNLPNKDEILDYIKNNPRCTYKKISQNYQLSKKTFYNYRKELGIKS